MPNTNGKMIGLSLSLCVSQIARKVVKEADVDMIITATNAPNIFSYLDVLSYYRKAYWNEFPCRASMIALRFYIRGKIDQPRTRGENGNFIGDGVWMDENQDTFHVMENGERQYSGEKVRPW